MKTNTDYKDAKKMKHYPFWYPDGTGKVIISISKLRRFLHDNGFYRRQVSDDETLTKSLIQESDGILTKHEHESIKDWVTEFIEENEGSNIRELDEILEGWLPYNNKIIDDNLTSYTCEEKPVFRDTKDTCYIPFRNGIVEITQNSIDLKPYEELVGEGSVWAKSIIPRDIDISDIPILNSQKPVVVQVIDKLGESPYSRFVVSSFKRGVSPTKGENLWKGIVDNDKQIKEFCDSINGFETGIGYLLHQYITQEKSPAIILVDGESMTSDLAEGGTGKSLSLKSLEHIRNVLTTDGKRLTSDSAKRFMFSNVTEETDLVIIDDVVPEFTQTDFFNVITGDFETEGKNKNKIILNSDNKPKLAITSNYVVPAKGGSEKRRQHIVSFGDFLNKVSKSKVMTTKDFFGKELFGDDFSQEDWNHYYIYHILCVQKYLNTGLIEGENLAYKSLVLEKGLGQPDVVEWVENWVDGERITSGCDKKGIALSQIYKSFSDHFVGNTILTEWDEKRFGDKLFDYVMGREDLEWNPDQASKGLTKRDRRWLKGPSGNQEPWVKVVNNTT